MAADPPLVDYEVLGDPRPQGSHRALVPKQGGPPIVIESAGQPLKDWRRSMVVAAREAWLGPPLHGPVAVNLTFRMPKPQAPQYLLPAVRPDIDKLCRAALDSLTSARVYRDDGQVVQLHATKIYESVGSPPGVRVRVWSAL